MILKDKEPGPDFGLSANLSRASTYPHLLLLFFIISEDDMVGRQMNGARNGSSSLGAGDVLNLTRAVRVQTGALALQFLLTLDTLMASMIAKGRRIQADNSSYTSTR